MKFSELGLKASSLKAIEAMGFEEATEIQQKSIPILLENEIDYVGQAQTGTGKTAAFVLPLLEKINFDADHVQALIVSPTRELANQIQEEIEKLSKFQKVRSMSVYGGTSVGMQIRDLKKKKPQIIVGTAGRLMDFIDRGVLNLNKVHYAILDEADEMLDMGFFDDIQEILSHMPNKNIWMFSATMPKQIKALINKHFCEPQFVKVEKQQLTSDAVSQYYMLVRNENKVEALCRFLDSLEDFYAIIFTQTKVGAKELTDTLNANGYRADSLHGDMSQDQRDLTMNAFKNKTAQLLVCTDVAARGIDVNDLTHVVNFGFPQDKEAYVHRIGRTGRGGKTGVALSILSLGEFSNIAVIEKMTKATVELFELPPVHNMKMKIINKHLKRFTQYSEKEILEPELLGKFENALADVTREELVEALYQNIYTDFVEKYNNAKPINLKPPKARTAGRKGYSKLWTSFGSNDGFEVSDVLRFFCEGLNISGKNVGKIFFRDSFAFIEVPEKYEDIALELNGSEYNSVKIKVQRASVDTSFSKRRDGRRSGGGYRGGNRRSGGGGGGYQNNRRRNDRRRNYNESRA